MTNDLKEYTLEDDALSTIAASMAQSEAEAANRAKDAKPLMLAALKAIGVGLVIAEYYGSGDSGDFENVTAYGAAVSMGAVTLPEGVYKIVLDYCWDILEADYGGWEINDGSRGQFAIDVGQAKVTHSHTSFYTAEETSEAEY